MRGRTTEVLSAPSPERIPATLTGHTPRKRGSMRNERTRIIAEIALTIALAAVLKFIGIRLPVNIAGGTVSLEMLPIIVLALRRGALPGVVAGSLFGLLDMLIEPYLYYPVQVALDYVVAFGVLGVAGFGGHAYRTAFDHGRHLRAAFVAVGWMLAAVAGRFAAHLVSGAIFFAENAPVGESAWLYSAGYNLSYLVPSAIASGLLLVGVMEALSRAVPVTARVREA